MTYIAITIVCVLLYAALYWLRKKGSYYKQVSEALQRRMIGWAQLDEKYERSYHQSRLEYMRRDGLSPEEAAEVIAADMNGEYNEFLEKMNEEEWDQNAPTLLKDMESEQGKQAIQNINASFELCDLFAETLAEKPLPDSVGAQSPVEFGTLIASFINSLQERMSIQIEPGSTGERLRSASENGDFEALSELQHTIMNEIHALSGDSRARYVFQLFWPHIFKGLNAKI